MKFNGSCHYLTIDPVQRKKCLSSDAFLYIGFLTRTTNLRVMREKSVSGPVTSKPGILTSYKYSDSDDQCKLRLLIGIRIVYLLVRDVLSSKTPGVAEKEVTGQICDGSIPNWLLKKEKIRANIICINQFRSQLIKRLLSIIFSEILGRRWLSISFSSPISYFDVKG